VHNSEVARSPSVDVHRMPSDQAPVVLPGRFATNFWFRAPDDLRHELAPAEVALIDEDALTRDELRQPTE
jgi:hypothetical protein